MQPHTDSHAAAIFLALLVTFLWSTSWMIIKAGLEGLPPFFLAGLRFTTAGIVLLPIALRNGSLRTLRRVTGRELMALVAVGLLYYGITQGGVFFSLSVMQATRFSLVMSASTMVVAFGSMIILKERPRLLQWGGTVIFLAGAILFLAPFDGSGGLIAFLAGAITLLSNSASALLTRSVNKSRILSPLGITTISAIIGGTSLLVFGAVVEGIPRMSAAQWGWLGWLAVVNTAFAFTLWNRAARVLSALESSVINNTMVFQVAILSWIILGENLGSMKIFALVMATAGVILVQVPPSFFARAFIRLRSRRKERR